MNAIYYTCHHFLNQKAVLEIDDCILDTNIKSIEKHADSKWITTWNDYLNDIKYFSRQLHKNKKKIENEYNEKRKWHRHHHQICKRLPLQRIKHLFRQFRPFN